MVFESLKQSVLELPIVGTLVQTLQRSARDHAKDMAASIAYFSFFSLFPLLVGIAAGAGFFLDKDKVRVKLDALLADKFPGSADFLRDNIETLIDLRGAATAVSIVGLLWSANKMSGAVSRGINQALDAKRTVPVILSPLRYFAMTLGISLLLFVGVAVSMALEFLPRLDLGGEISVVLTWLSSSLASYFFVFVMLVLLFKLVPYQRPAWREVLTGALVGAFLFEIGKSLFGIYVQNIAHLQAVYGSLSSIIVLLLWLYFSARVLLFGAELVAVLGDEARNDGAQGL